MDTFAFILLSLNLFLMVYGEPLMTKDLDKDLAQKKDGIVESLKSMKPAQKHINETAVKIQSAERKPVVIGKPSEKEISEEKSEPGESVHKDEEGRGKGSRKEIEADKNKKSEVGKEESVPNSESSSKHEDNDEKSPSADGELRGGAKVVGNETSGADLDDGSSSENPGYEDKNDDDDDEDEDGDEKANETPSGTPVNQYPVPWWANHNLPSSAVFHGLNMFVLIPLGFFTAMSVSSSTTSI